jgi:hypothetical protein
MRLDRTAAGVVKPTWLVRLNQHACGSRAHLSSGLFVPTFIDKEEKGKKKKYESYGHAINTCTFYSPTLTARLTSAGCYFFWHAANHGMCHAGLFDANHKLCLFGANHELCLFDANHELCLFDEMCHAGLFERKEYSKIRSKLDTGRHVSPLQRLPKKPTSQIWAKPVVSKKEAKQAMVMEAAIAAQKVNRVLFQSTSLSQQKQQQQRIQQQQQQRQPPSSRQPSFNAGTLQRSGQGQNEPGWMLSPASSMASSAPINIRRGYDQFTSHIEKSAQGETREGGGRAITSKPPPPRRASHRVPTPKKAGMVANGVVIVL